MAVQQIATDAFGQALGNAFVDGAQNPGTQAQKLQGFGPASGLDYVNGADLQSDNTYYNRATQQALAGGAGQFRWDNEAPMSPAQQYAQTYGGEVQNVGDRLTLSKREDWDFLNSGAESGAAMNKPTRVGQVNQSQRSKAAMDTLSAQAATDRSLSNMQDMADAYRASGYGAGDPYASGASTATPGADRWVSDSSGLGGTVIGQRMTQAEMDAFDRLNPGVTGGMGSNGSITPISEVEGFFTFNPAGRALKGAGTAAFDAWTALPNALRGLGTLAGDAVGYAGNAIAPQRSVLTGQPFAYQPNSALLQSIQQQGGLGTLGTGITGVVRNAPGIGLIGALGAPNRDWGNVGAQAFNAGMLGASGVIDGIRNPSLERMTGGLRSSPSLILNDAQIQRITREFGEVGGDPSILRFNSGRQTSYVDELNIIRVRGDVLPLEDASHVRSTMSSRATLAHELGHQAHQGTGVQIGAWNDEFRASYWAAKNAPGLSMTERVDLLNDAVSRAREAGVPIKMNKFMQETLYGY